MSLARNINSWTAHQYDSVQGRNEIIEFDAEECAIGANLQAIADYETLAGEESAAMTAFLRWTYVNLDSEAIIKAYGEKADE